MARGEGPPGARSTGRTAPCTRGHRRPPARQTRTGTMTASPTHLHHSGVHGGDPSLLGPGTGQHRIWGQCRRDAQACNPVPV